ncbi:hypothetical protein [Mesorhizobium sp. SP-1A]|uniref:hypothetical protein n=1 Tax=Mesorhizobium sp. SP-1A TaxID=3077840 RepID=UPI0028F6D5D9|nr:hypothetical protein [Mesorhizobium sp. SP-1A]
MRPFTLLEVSERVRNGANSVKEFSEFLDYFYDRTTQAQMIACLADEPLILDDQRLNALYAASADYLSKRYRLSFTPKWVYDPKRFLDEPWFSTTEEDLREYLTFTSPSEFRSRNIFTEAVPLRRARTWQAEQRVEQWLSEPLDHPVHSPAFSR